MLNFHFMGKKYLTNTDILFSLHSNNTIYILMQMPCNKKTSNMNQVLTGKEVNLQILQTYGFEGFWIK